MDCSERLEGGVAQRLERREFGDIGHDADHIAAERLQFRSRLLDEGGIDVGYDALHALARESLEQRLPDATSAPGDDGDLPGEVLHDSSDSARCGHLALAASRHR